MRDQKKLMSGIIIIFLIAVTGAYLLGTAIARDSEARALGRRLAAAARPAGPDSPVAEVGGKRIPRWMFDNACRDRVRSEEKRNGPLNGNDVKRLQTEIMDNLISMELLAQQAAAAGIVMSPGAGELRLRIVEASFKDRPSFEAALREAGMDRERYRAIWQQQALVNRYVDERIKPGVTVNEADLKALYTDDPARFIRPEQARASHILIRPGPDRDAARARASAEDLRRRLKAGADFAALAREHSACPSAKQGGDLGWFTRGKMDKAFEEAAFALQEGGLSAVVQGKAGYHIIKKTGHKPAYILAYEEARPELERIVTDAAVKAALDNHIAELKKRVPIKIHREG